MKPNLKISVLSPLHVGTGEMLYDGVDFVTRDGRCHFIDIERLAPQLQSAACIDDYVNLMEDRNHRNTRSLLQFLQDNRIALEAVARPHHSNRKTDVFGKQVRSFVRDVRRRPYIPGTAIKGAIRTAILWRMLKELRDADATSFRRRVVDKIRAVLDDRRKKPQQKKKEVGEFLTRDFFQHCTSRTDEPHTDLLRALKVGDSRPLDPDTLDFDLVRMISLDKGDGDGWHFSFRKKRGEVLKDRTTGKPLPIDIFTEVLTPGPGTAEIEGTISIDQTILADLETSPRTTAVPSWFWTIESIIDTCQDFTRHCIQEEEKRFYNRLKGVERIEAFYRETEPNLRIGWGSGLIETTIISLLPDAVRDRVRELFWDRWMQQAFQGQSKDFPKTRRAIVYNDEPVVPLGWVRLEAGQ